MKLDKKSLLHGFSGRLGDFYLRTVRGQTHLCMRPAGRKKSTKAQNVVNNRFALATQYGKQQAGDPVSRRLYENGITANKSSVYLVALSDFLNAPEITRIMANKYHGKPGDRIYVMATDDFMVTEVRVEIFSSNGMLIEEGQAIQRPKKANSWRYDVKVDNSDFADAIIRATAYDRPRNRTTKEIVVGALAGGKRAAGPSAVASPFPPAGEGSARSKAITSKKPAP
jgi:hypothetical protein